MRTRAAQWVAINIVGMLAYLCVASDLWVPVSHFGEPGGPGDAFVVMFFLWPMLGAFALLDAVAFVVIARRMVARTGRPCALCTWACVTLLWVSVLLLDRLLAFNIIDARYT